MRRVNLSAYFLPLLLFSGALMTIPGCTVWADFTTYFNVYYNADEMFTEAESAILAQRKDPFTTFDAPLPGNASTLLDKVVEKCSKILQFNATSNLVDDALMMLGKAFYYQRNYIKAKRKFQELIATRAESGLILEAKLWLAKTEMQMKNFAEGLAGLEEVHAAAKEAEEDEILSQTFIEQIKYFLVTEDFENAINRCRDFLTVNKDDELNARAAYQIGELFAAQGSYRSARDYYFMAYDMYSPPFELGFSARNKYGKMLLRLGENEPAEKMFRYLRSEEKYREFYDQIDFAFILSEIRKGNFEEAYRNFSTFDTTYPSSQQLGNVRYEMGLMFEKEYKNYDSAFTLYQKASSSSATAEYLQLIREKTQSFSKYRAIVSDYLEQRKMEYYATDSAAFRRDSLEYYKTDSSAVRQQDSTILMERYTGIGGDRERDFGFDEAPPPQEAPQITSNDGQPPPPKGPPPKRPSISLDSIRTSLAKSLYELGNIFFTYLDVPDSARHYYLIALQDCPGSPYEAKTLFALANYYKDKGDSVVSDSLFHVVYKNYKHDRIVNEAARRLSLEEIDFDFDPAKKLYADAEGALIRKQYDSAYEAMSLIYHQHPTSAFAVKALYASAFILEEGLRLLDSAAAVYDSLLIKHSTSVFAQKALPKLQFYKQEKQRLAQLIADSLRRIEDSIKAVRDSIALRDSLQHIKTLAPEDSLAAADKLNQSDSLHSQKPAVPPKEEGEERPPEEEPETKQNKETPIEREKISFLPPPSVYRLKLL